jgi:hypothetical protein
LRPDIEIDGCVRFGGRWSGLLCAHEPIGEPITLAIRAHRNVVNRSKITKTLQLGMQSKNID